MKTFEMGFPSKYGKWMLSSQFINQSPFCSMKNKGFALVKIM